MNKKIPLIFGVPQQSFFKGWKAKKVFVAELRPSLAGMKTTSNLLIRRGIRPVIICDNMLAFCMKQGLVKEVHIFYHDINGKVALCRTGSFIAALCAREHKIPVVLHKGAAMPLKSSSLLFIDGISVTTQDIKTYKPVFEEVPMRWVKLEKEGKSLV